MKHFKNEEIKVVGTFYVNRHGKSQVDFFSEVVPGDRVVLIRNPGNIHDSNAIEVYVSNKMLGHIPRDIAGQRLAHILDSDRKYESLISKKINSNGRISFRIKLTTFPEKRTSEYLNGNVLKVRGSAQRTLKKHVLLNISFRAISDLESYFRNASGKSGIYCIWSNDHKSYIGQSNNIGRRWREHYNDLIKGMHGNSRLQHAWSIMGVNKFRFDIVEETYLDLDQKEEQYIEMARSYAEGYNLTPDGQGIESYFISEKYSNAQEAEVFISSKLEDSKDNIRKEFEDYERCVTESNTNDVQDMKDWEEVEGRYWEQARSKALKQLGVASEKELEFRVFSGWDIMYAFVALIGLTHYGVKFIFAIALFIFIYSNHKQEKKSSVLKLEKEVIDLQCKIFHEYKDKHEEMIRIRSLKELDEMYMLSMNSKRIESIHFY